MSTHKTELERLHGLNVAEANAKDATELFGLLPVELRQKILSRKQTGVRVGRGTFPLPAPFNDPAMILKYVRRDAVNPYFNESAYKNVTNILNHNGRKNALDWNRFIVFPDFSDEKAVLVSEDAPVQIYPWSRYSLRHGMPPAPSAVLVNTKDRSGKKIHGFLFHLDKTMPMQVRNIDTDKWVEAQFGWIPTVLLEAAIDLAGYAGYMDRLRLAKHKFYDFAFWGF